METFAQKVRYGGGGRFDPMLEEKGGWVAGEDPKRDEEMAEAVMEVLAQASDHVHEGHLNPFREQVGEILPTNLERNFSGFLVRKDAISFKVDPVKVSARIDLLKNQLLIAKFVGPKPTFQDMEKWLQALNQQIGESVLSFCMNVGKGYFFLKGEDSDALSRALMMSPHKSKWGTCMIQSWVLGFNPDNPSNLAFPTWVALRRLPFEHHDQALAIVETLGEVIGMDTTNKSARDPSFCVNLMVNKGWVTSIDLVSDDGTLPPQRVLVDYDRLPMRCKACHSWKHRVHNCNDTQKRFVKSGRRPTHTHHAFQQEEGKNIVDEDGFQPVRNRKNTKRNIFDLVDDERSSSAQALAEEIKTARNRAKSLVGETSRMQVPQTIHEKLAAPRQERMVDSTRQPQKTLQVNSAVKGPANTANQIQEGRREVCNGGPMPNNVGADDSEMEIDIAAAAAEAVVNLESPVEGRGDPASTMLWSPRKHVGQKRPLERMERETSEEEESASERWRDLRRSREER